MQDQTTVVLKIGTEGGDIVLLGRQEPAGTWQFKRVTGDQTDVLLGEAETSWHSESGWVEGSEAALEQLDRYPWAMLYPLEVHPEFRERVREALDARWAKAGSSRQVERVREKWTTVLEGREP